MATKAHWVRINKSFLCSIDFDTVRKTQTIMKLHMPRIVRELKQNWKHETKKQYSTELNPMPHCLFFSPSLNISWVWISAATSQINRSINSFSSNLAVGGGIYPGQYFTSRAAFRMTRWIESHWPYFHCISSFFTCGWYFCRLSPYRWTRFSRVKLPAFGCDQHRACLVISTAAARVLQIFGTQLYTSLLRMIGETA